MFAVLQNGSLLIVEDNYEAFEIHDDNYCLDEGAEGLYAIVCIRSESNIKTHVLRGEAVINAVCLWVSVPCLLLTAFFYLKIRELRELHGKTLGNALSSVKAIKKKQIKIYQIFNISLQHAIVPV